MRDYEKLVERLHKRIGSTVAGSPLQDDLLEAADAIEELVSNADKFKWVRVEEWLPEPFESVLVCYQREGRYGTSCGHYYLDRGTTIWKASGIIPTHWMPLPEPPKEKS